MNFNRIIHQLNAQAIIEDAERLAARRRRQIFIRGNPFLLHNTHFRRLFRLNKQLARNVVDIVEQYSEASTRSSALKPETKALCALRFYAGGSYQLDVGNNFNIGLSQSSASRCIREVTTILNHPDVLNEWIHFPRNLEELTSIRNGFYALYGFPGVAGCIDCTHVAIYPPKTHDENFPKHVYVNRKGYHSINVQLICDSRMRILNVNARYPGSCHDSFIWNNSNVLPVLQNIHERGHENFYLLGDSGYALRPWLLTPLAEAALDTPEWRYNECFKKTRSIIERCNGLLKMRFRCLLKHRLLHYSPDVASKIINACCVLHNMCVDANLPVPELEDDEDPFDFGMFDIEPANVAIARRANLELGQARRIQQRLLRNYFY